MQDQYKGNNNYYFLINGVCTQHSVLIYVLDLFARPLKEMFGHWKINLHRFFFYLIIRQEILEQERRDRELALRLASEDQNEVEDVVVPPLQRYELLLHKKSHSKQQINTRNCCLNVVSIIEVWLVTVWKISWQIKNPISIVLI